MNARQESELGQETKFDTIETKLPRNSEIDKVHCSDEEDDMININSEIVYEIAKESGVSYQLLELSIKHKNQVNPKNNTPQSNWLHDTDILANSVIWHIV